MEKTRRGIVLTAGSLAIAGCSTSSDSTDNTDSPVGTPEGAPQIETISLITGWDSFGDVIENQIDSIEAGEDAIIGCRFWYYVNDGSIKARHQLTFYGPDDTQLGVRNGTTDRLAEEEGWEDWEWYERYGTTEDDLGTYRVVWQIRDETNDEVSETAETTFELV